MGDDDGWVLVGVGLGRVSGASGIDDEWALGEEGVRSRCFTPDSQDILDGQSMRGA